MEREVMVSTLRSSWIHVTEPRTSLPPQSWATLGLPFSSSGPLHLSYSLASLIHQVSASMQKPSLTIYACHKYLLNPYYTHFARHKGYGG